MASAVDDDTPQPEADAPLERPPTQVILLRRRVTPRRLLFTALGLVVIGLLAWVFFGIGVGTLLEKILHLPAWLILLLVFLLPGLEASIFLGIFFPGEVAVLLGGVAASQGSVEIALVIVAACLGAVLGDQVGYLVGREWGEQVLRKIPDRLLDEDRLQKGRSYVRRMGAKGVILGRWTAALRALVPGLAGMSHMHYPRFLIANVIGGVGWATLVAVVGYLAGNSYKKVESALGSVSYVLLGLIVVGLIAWHIVRRRRERTSVG
ncbi:MAG TPA: DedA family protein [Frankiaceae bacterium]|jgi:undecaprenyl-diphosphatase|nr:DedA family protein [Frankiaceae bacterium]